MQVARKDLELSYQYYQSAMAQWLKQQSIYTQQAKEVQKDEGWPDTVKFDPNIGQYGTFYEPPIEPKKPDTKPVTTPPNKEKP
jgi:hypothetical protein